MQLFAINAGNFKLDGGAMHGVVPKSMWNKLNPADENNMCSWSMRCLLVQEGNKLMLIDNGMGNKQDEKFFGHYFLHGNDTLEKSLNKYGFSVDDITDVFLTHLHFDHCGGSIQWNKNKSSLEPTFKNAHYWSNKNQWNWAVQPNAREKASFLKENILPIEQSGQLKFIEKGDEVFNDMRVEFVDGHTEKMMLPVIHYKGKKIIFMADLIPSVHHIPLAWVMSYDVRPLITLQEKERILNWAANENAVLFFEHDAINECCTIKNTEKGIRFDSIFRLDEF